MLRDVLRIRRDTLTYLSRLVARHGDLVSFPTPRTPTLLVNDPAGVRRVLVENPRAYTKATVQYGSLAAVTGSGLLVADGEPWRRRRRVVQPAFHHGNLDAVAAEAVRAADRVASRWCDLAPGAVVDVDAAMMATTLEVVGRTLFDADLGGSDSQGDGERVVAAVRDALEVVVQRARSPRPRWLPLPSSRRLARAVAILDDTCARVVRERRAAGVTAGATAGGGDLLGLLLRAADAAGGLSDRAVRDELVTLVIAGHETVASSLTWTLRLLAEHSEVQDRVADELAATLGGRDPRWADLPALAGVRRVVEESLRLYPPAWVLSRRALAADVIAGVPVPAGTVVIISPWLLHRRPQSWPDPERFDPARFDPARFSGSASAPRGDYLPFGLGPRLCIGREFALVETVLVLATLLQRVRVGVVPRPGVGPTPRPATRALVTLRPLGGLPLVVAPR
jgi:cytochrome P450